MNLFEFPPYVVDVYFLPALPPNSSPLISDTRSQSHLFLVLIALVHSLAIIQKLYHMPEIYLRYNWRALNLLECFYFSGCLHSCFQYVPFPCTPYSCQIIFLPLPPGSLGLRQCGVHSQDCRLSQFSCGSSAGSGLGCHHQLLPPLPLL